MTMLSYGQTMSKIEIKHIGEIDKPFPVIEIYSGKYDYNLSEEKSSTGKLVILDTLVFSKVIQYLDSEKIGLLDTSDLKYGTFSVSFFDKEKCIKTIFLSQEGAVYLLINLQLYVPDKPLIFTLQGMVRRLLYLGRTSSKSEKNRCEYPRDPEWSGSFLKV